jgi:hypothetical protein
MFLAQRLPEIRLRRNITRSVMTTLNQLMVNVLLPSLPRKSVVLP